MSTPGTYSSRLIGFSGNRGPMVPGGMRRSPGGRITITEGAATIEGLGGSWKFESDAAVVVSQCGPIFSLDTTGQGVRFFTADPGHLAQALTLEGFTLTYGLKTKSGLIAAVLGGLGLFLVAGVLDGLGSFVSFWLRVH